jgi:hypothetical protein
MNCNGEFPACQKALQVGIWQLKNKLSSDENRID